jgi:predicted site-specific integrase-resolvase
MCFNVSMKSTYSPQEFGQLIGRKTKTLQKWDREGELKAHRSPTTNRRYYTHDQYLQYRGFVAPDQGLTIAYTWVAGLAQKPDLAHQIKALEIYCQQQGIRTELVVINGEAMSPEQEFVRDLIAILTVFSARWHGLRSYRKVLKVAALQKG